MGYNGSVILIILLLHWQLASGAGSADPISTGTESSGAGSADPISAGSADPISAGTGSYNTPSYGGYGIVYGNPYRHRGGGSTGKHCGENYTLPCAEVNAIRTVINSLRLIPTIDVSATYCEHNSNSAINCTCDRDDQNFFVCHISEINLSKEGLRGYIHPAIGDLHLLRRLNLSSNQLTRFLPASLGNLTNLEILDLASNYLDGPIPSSLGDLQNLTFIALRFNFLSGTIPTSLGKLSSLQTMSAHSNMLSGPIPNDLGNLSQLKILSLDDNELNGTLPESFGKLRNLTNLWLTSNYFTGIIPESYSNLTGLQEFALAGNDLSGNIPDYIVKWKNLTILILLGNNFEGNLPEGIFNLEKLQTLWVSGLRNPGFAFPEKKDLTTNLYSLILRNCSINKTIPSYISGWPILEILDLSFNNLSGEIPKFRKNLNKIFLARNKLNGALPLWKSKEHHKQETTNNAAIMDLSNNDFADGPSENGALLGLPNIIVEPRSQYISQKRKECKVKHRSLSINSGGDEVKFGKQIYENDTAFSNFYVSPQGNWAYSFSGDYISRTVNASGYIQELTCVVSPPEAKLYVNARAAPLSLTYYAFCLHQGIYNVELLFAETLYSNMEDHSKVGKRVFDVYIQKDNVLRDFNIKKEAGDANKDITKSFQIEVTKEKPVLTIDFLWTGRGSIYNPPGQNGPLISAISITRAPRKLSAWEIVVIAVACVLGLLILLLILLAFMWRMGWIGDRELRETNIELETQGKKRPFTVKEIVDATQNFSPKMMIGKDDLLGTLYKAELPNLIVAVKKLLPQSKGIAEIGTEVYAKTFIKLEHENLVNLMAAYSRKGLHFLIYEYMGLGSLEQVLFDPKFSRELSWENRYNICLQIAQGLEFLHAKNPPVVHRDIKASNIMLDAISKAKISGFGLAKLYEEDNTLMFIEDSGTRMYMAPEYATRGVVTEAIDIYSFGIILLEIVTGKRNDEDLSENHDRTIFLIEKVEALHATVKEATLQYKQVKYTEVVDKKLNSNYSKEEVVTIIDLAMLCISRTASLRPKISDIISVLQREITVEDVFQRIKSKTPLQCD